MIANRHQEHRTLRRRRLPLLAAMTLVAFGFHLSVSNLLQSIDTGRVYRRPTLANATWSASRLPPLVVEHAMTRVRERQQAYQAVGRPWAKRGLGYLHDVHRLVLAAVVPPPETGRNVLTIDNVLGQHATDCHLWTIWVRVNGREILAGSAAAVNDGDDSSCHWEFAYHLQLPGDYQVDVKVLLYNGEAAVDQRHCHVQTGIHNLPLAQYPSHEALMGFKLYTPDTGCCEICARTDGCRYWVTPPLTKALSAREAGCELFFDARDEAFHRRRLQSLEDTSLQHGPPHADPTAYFVGCGWSFWLTNEFPCLDPHLDDAIDVYPSRQFTLEILQKRTALPNELPQCNIDRDERQRKASEPATGRWVREPFPDANACPRAMQIDQNHSSMFEITEWDPEHPPCWHRDNLSAVGSHCMEFCAQGTHQPWVSSLHTEQHWFGRWQNYHCNYREFTNAELQQCIDRRLITSIVFEGRSVAAFLRQYLNQRLQGLVLADVTNGLKVTLSTFSLPHLLWRQSRPEWEQFIDDLPVVNASTDEYYGLTGYYYTSEREPHVHVGRSLQLSRLLMSKLPAKGYRMIEAFDLTAAFTYDTATQMDGLHIIGPPAKMILTKLFHYVCQDVL